MKAFIKKALSFAQKHTCISENDLDLLHHCRQSVLFNNGEPWTKKDSPFDVGMGAYDGAEVAELVGLLILSKINEQFPQLNFGLYRDDGLAVYKSMRGGDHRSV